MLIRTVNQWNAAWDAAKGNQDPITYIECRGCGYWTDFPPEIETPHPDDDPLWCSYCGVEGILDLEGE